jgi:hypothetical protein
MLHRNVRITGYLSNFKKRTFKVLGGGSNNTAAGLRG